MVFREILTRKFNLKYWLCSSSEGETLATTIFIQTYITCNKTIDKFFIVRLTDLYV